MQNDSEEPPPDGRDIVPYLRARMRAFLMKSLPPYEVARLMRKYDKMWEDDNRQRRSRQDGTQGQGRLLPK